MLERLFHLRRHGTTAQREVLGGTTTFLTMAYIIVVNPAVLSFAGLPVGPSTVATILTAAFGSLLMGFYANRPIAVAPYMGENAFLAFGLAALGITWQQRLGAVFVGGVLFALMTVLGLRTWLADALSPSMKHSFAAGIGLFLALIGLYESGIVTSGVTGALPSTLLISPGGRLLAPPAPLKIGALHEPTVLLALMALLIMIVLLQRRVRGALLIAIVITAGVGTVLGQGAPTHAVVAMPFVGPYSLEPIAFKLDVLGVLRPAFWPVLLTLLLMSLLDTLGTLMGVGAAAGLLDERGNFPQVERPMLVDALSSAFSGLVGTSTSGAYIESASGIRDGARTGLAAVTTGLLFGTSLFFIPLFEPLQTLRYAYAPALVAVGVLVAGSVRHVDFDDLTEAFPAFLTIAMMVFSYNIANGLTAGLIAYPLVKLLCGRAKEVRASSIVLAVLCAAYYVVGFPH